MASLSMPIVSTNLSYFMSSKTPPCPSSLYSCFPSTSSFSAIKTPKRVLHISCNATNGDENPSQVDVQASLMKFDRRNVLLGLGGLYGTSALTSNSRAFAAPLAPDFKDCMEAKEPDGTLINCCPAEHKSIAEHVPSPPKVSAIRPAAQNVDAAYIKRYRKAVEKMRQLKSSDPRNFTQQANVHCAYCNGAYSQEGYPDLILDVHMSSIFFPFHRWYLYFFEKICQNMLDDDTFGIPFWQWDDPAGMLIPPLFNETPSPLFDPLRNPSHLPPTLIDLNFDGTDQNLKPTTQIINNLFTMNKQMVTQSSTPEKFFGSSYVAGESPDPGQGSIEASPHNNIHRWTGDPRQHQNENMGTFFAAARDPIFYAHHANVDRMWVIWNTLLGGRNLKQYDWLNTSFFFYNAEAKLVSVKVRDCLDIKNLGYAYEDARILWLNYRPQPRRRSITIPDAPAASEVFPLRLEQTVTVTVPRPKKSRSRKEKEEAEEVLAIEGIEYNKGEFLKFDVYVNEDNPEECGPERTEFVGSFVNVSHGHQMIGKTSKCFSLNDVLDDLGANDFDKILVTLVPRSGVVTIKGIKIKFDTSNQDT